MRYSKVLKIDIYNKTVKFILKNRLLIILTAIFLFGFSFAVFASGKYEFITEWSQNYLNSRYIKIGNATFLKLVLNSFLSSSLFLVLCIVCGTSMFGVIIVPLLILIKGFMYGGISAYLYSVYSFEGVAFYAVIILPAAIMFTITLILCSISAINFSLNLARLTFKESYGNSIYFEFKRLTYKFLVYSAFVLISSIVEALLTTGFLKNFSGIL